MHQLLQQLIEDFAAGGVDLRFEQVSATQYRFHAPSQRQGSVATPTVLLTADGGTLVAHTEADAEQGMKRMGILDYLEYQLSGAGDAT